MAACSWKMSMVQVFRKCSSSSLSSCRLSFSSLISSIPLEIYAPRPRPFFYFLLLVDTTISLFWAYWPAEAFIVTLSTTIVKFGFAGISRFKVSISLFTLAPNNLVWDAGDRYKTLEPLWDSKLGERCFLSWIGLLWSDGCCWGFCNEPSSYAPSRI